MKYLSVCSGIEAATVAWHHMGWQPVAFSDIEPFPSAVLAHHYPNVPNLGDMTKFEEWNLEPIDLLVGGTPCQSFSVAGLRKGLSDPRGGLMLTYLEIARRYRPRWVVWENVPGVLSSNRGRDFGAFLGALGELGYGFAYRVLDAQWFGVAQRRRRVFVVGHLGDYARAAAVLFERQSVRRDTPPSREARKGTTASTKSGFDERGLQRTVGTLCADTHPGAYSGQDAYTGRLVPYTQEVADPLTANEGRTYTHEGRNNFRTRNVQAVAQPTFGIPGNWIGRKPENGGNAVAPMHDVAPCLTKTDRHGVATMQVRRLTPVECERLQGFPDNYTRIPWKVGYWAADKNSPEVLETIAKQCPDGPRYKALGNSMAVPVMRWIGERINKVDAE